MNDNNISTFYVLDLDRTLFDTIKDAELMRDVVALHDSSLAMALEQEFKAYTLQGESFSMRNFIIEHIGEEGMAQVEVKYKELAMTRDLLNPGAKELLEYVRTLTSTKFGILTFGSPQGQALKMEASGFSAIPFLVTSETFKGVLIAGWRQDDGLYHVPEELGGWVATNIVFVDDKPFSFKGFPIDCVGYLVRSIFDAGLDGIPSNVTIVDTLNEVIIAEKKRVS